jgi:hypothetical protein
VEQIRTAGPLREIPMGKITDAVAAAPEDSDFTNAAVWQIKLPADLNLAVDPILRINYVGDVARLSLDGKLLTDDFYNGNPLEVGLRRYAPQILRGDLFLKILPLQKNAPIYLAKEAEPAFEHARSLVALREIQIIPRYTVQLESRVPSAK